MGDEVWDGSMGFDSKCFIGCVNVVVNSMQELCQHHKRSIAVYVGTLIYT